MRTIIFFLLVGLPTYAQFFEINLLGPKIDGNTASFEYSIANFNPDLGDTVAVIAGPPGVDIEERFLEGSLTVLWVRGTSSPVVLNLEDGPYEAIALHLSGLFDSVEPGFRRTEILARSERVAFEIKTQFSEFLFVLPKSTDFRSELAVLGDGVSLFDLRFPGSCIFDPECATISQETAELVGSGVYDITGLASQRPVLVRSENPLSVSLIITDLLPGRDAPVSNYQIPPYQRSLRSTLTGLVLRSQEGLPVTSAAVVASFNDAPNQVLYSYREMGERNSRTGSLVVPPYGIQILWVQDVVGETDGIYAFEFKGELPILTIGGTFNKQVPNYTVGDQR